MPISTLPATFEQLLEHEIFDDFVGSGDLYDYLKEYGLKTPHNWLYHNLLREGFAQLDEADQLQIIQWMQYNTQEYDKQMAVYELADELESQGATPNAIRFAKQLTHDLYDNEGTAELYEYLQNQYGLNTPDGGRDHPLIVAEFAKLTEADQLQILDSVQQAIQEDLAARREWEEADERPDDLPILSAQS